MGGGWWRRVGFRRWGYRGLPASAGLVSRVCFTVPKGRYEYNALAWHEDQDTILLPLMLSLVSYYPFP